MGTPSLYPMFMGSVGGGTSLDPVTDFDAIAREGVTGRGRIDVSRGGAATPTILIQGSLGQNIDLTTLTTIHFTIYDKCTGKIYVDQQIPGAGDSGADWPNGVMAMVLSQSQVDGFPIGKYTIDIQGDIILYTFDNFNVQ